MKIKKFTLGIFLILGLLIASSCAQTSTKPSYLLQEIGTPTVTPIAGGSQEQASPQPPVPNIQGSIDFIFIYAIYHPGDMDYSTTINVPFHVNKDDSASMDLIGKGGSAVVSAVEVTEDCPINIEETFKIQNVGGNLITDAQDHLLLHITYQTNSVGEYYVTCEDISLPLGGSDWSENEVTLPTIDGYVYVPSPDSPIRYVVHLDKQP